MNPFIFQSIIFKFVLYVIVEFVHTYENERSFYCLWLYYFHIILQEHTCPIKKSTNYQRSLQTLLECFNRRSTHNVHLYVIIMLQIIIIPLWKARCIFLNLSDWIISYQYEYFVYPSCTVADFNASCTNEYSWSSFFVLGLSNMAMIVI